MFSFCNDKPIGSVSIWFRSIRIARIPKDSRAPPRKNRSPRLASPRPTRLVKAPVRAHTHTHTRARTTQPCCSRNKVTFPLPDITYSGIKAGHEAVLVRTTRMGARTPRVNEKNRAEWRGKGLAEEMRRRSKSAEFMLRFQLTRATCCREPNDAHTRDIHLE